MSESNICDLKITSKFIILLLFNSVYLSIVRITAIVSFLFFFYLFPHRSQSANNKSETRKKDYLNESLMLREGKDWFVLTGREVMAFCRIE